MWIEKQVFRPLIRLAEDWVDKDILIELILEGKEGGEKQLNRLSNHVLWQSKSLQYEYQIQK